MEPGKEPLDFPAVAVTAQFAAILSAFAAANVLVGRDESNAVFSPQALVERVAVVGTVTDYSFRFGSCEALLDGSLDELRFMRRSAGDAAGDRKTYAEIEAATIEQACHDPFGLILKPEIPQDGEKRTCPNCGTESVFNPFHLFYRGDARGHAS